MGREKRRKSLSLAFLLPITPRAPLGRDTERWLGTSQIQDILELWIPCCGFRTSGTGLRISWQWNLDYRFQSLVGFRIPQAKISQIPETGLPSILLTRRKIGLSVNLQSWTKVLWTVLQYSYFSVISRFPLKTVHRFRNFFAVLPPPTLYKVETRKKFWIHASNIVCGVRGGVGPVWIGKRPKNAKVSQDFCPWLLFQ